MRLPEEFLGGVFHLKDGDSIKHSDINRAADLDQGNMSPRDKVAEYLLQGEQHLLGGSSSDVIGAVITLSRAGRIHHTPPGPKLHITSYFTPCQLPRLHFYAIPGSTKGLIAVWLGAIPSSCRGYFVNGKGFRRFY